MKRNGFSYQQTLDRINSQKSEEDYLKIADKVILNNGTLEELERQVIELFER
jgi:dephospho-CoA kinase